MVPATALPVAIAIWWFQRSARSRYANNRQTVPRNLAPWPNRAQFPPYSLRREEWFRGVGKCRLIHTAASIGHCNHDVRAGRKPYITRRYRLDCFPMAENVILPPEGIASRELAATLTNTVSNCPLSATSL